MGERACRSPRKAELRRRRRWLGRCTWTVLGSWLLVGLEWRDRRRAAAWTDALFPENRHDFGMVPRGVKVKHDFLLVNRLAEPITILNLRPSCGCTSGRANASTVAPGQTAVIEAEMDTRNFVGPKSTVLFVTLITASGREGEARLAVSSHILSDIVLNPGAIDFGTVDARSVADPGLDDRPDQRAGLAVRAHGLGQPGAQCAARRDRSDSDAR